MIEAPTRRAGAQMTIRSTIMFATRLERHDSGTCLAGFMRDEQVAKLCFYKPVERVVVREGETSEYWAWWDARETQFRYVFLSRVQIDMCFPYGSDVETKKGNGEIVNVMIEVAP